jgi:ABC-type transporter Mla subunit MlaD
MVDQKLLTIFVALTSVAVLIQTGILAGLYFLSTKVNRQLDSAMDVSRNLLGPLQKTVENLQAVSKTVAEYSSKAQRQLRQLEHRWSRPAA